MMMMMMMMMMATPLLLLPPLLLLLQMYRYLNLLHFFIYASNVEFLLSDFKSILTRQLCRVRACVGAWLFCARLGVCVCYACGCWCVDATKTTTTITTTTAETTTTTTTTTATTATTTTSTHTQVGLLEQHEKELLDDSQFPLATLFSWTADVVTDRSQWVCPRLIRLRLLQQLTDINTQSIELAVVFNSSPPCVTCANAKATRAHLSACIVVRVGAFARVCVCAGVGACARARCGCGRGRERAQCVACVEDAVVSCARPKKLRAFD
jgi:hypothetical protein